MLRTSLSRSHTAGLSVRARVRCALRTHPPVRPSVLVSRVSLSSSALRSLCHRCRLTADARQQQKALIEPFIGIGMALPVAAIPVVDLVPVLQYRHSIPAARRSCHAITIKNEFWCCADGGSSDNRIIMRSHHSSAKTTVSRSRRGATEAREVDVVL